MERTETRRKGGRLTLILVALASLLAAPLACIGEHDRIQAGISFRKRLGLGAYFRQGT
jgi:hypothetical protein